MTDYIPDPISTYAPRKPVVHQNIPSETSNAALLTAPELEKLEGMSREELLTLVRMVYGAIWGYALADDTQKADAARLKLYNMGMSATEVHKVVPALDKWFDRTSGKAAQSIAMTVEDKGLGKLTTERLLALDAELCKRAGEAPMIIAPMPKKLSEST